MFPREITVALSLSLLIGVVLVAALVSAHEKHYAKRRLILLEARMRAVESILVEDRTV